MRWEIETWRKIYTGKPASWLALPVSARGLGRELLTYCDDEGRILIGSEAPGSAIARLLSAHRGEYKRIDLDVAALLQDGYLMLDGRHLVIRNFPKAQERSTSAERQRRYRARSLGDTSDRNALRVTHASPGDAGDASRSDGSRSRSRSRSEIPPNPPPSGGDGDGLPGSDPPAGSPRHNGTNLRASGQNPRAVNAPSPPEPYAEGPPPPPRAEVTATLPTGPDAPSLAALAARIGRRSPSPEEAPQ